MMYEWAHCHHEAANHQLSEATAFRMIWIVLAEECSSQMQNLMQIHCSTCSGISNVMATQHTCSLNRVSAPLTSAVKLSLFTRVHSSPLSLAARFHQCCINGSHYINNGWTFTRQASYTPICWICFFLTFPFGGEINLSFSSVQGISVLGLLACRTSSWCVLHRTRWHYFRSDADSYLPAGFSVDIWLHQDCNILKGAVLPQNTFRLSQLSTSGSSGQMEWLVFMK